MPAPFTVVTLVDEDGEEFPIRLPGFWPENAPQDAQAALEIAKEQIRHGEISPRGALHVGRIECI